MVQKLLLTYPNQRWHKDDFYSVSYNHPMTLCLLAAMVKDIVDVKIIDANFYDLSIEEFKKEVSEYDPDVVGISLLTSEYAIVLDIAAGIVKSINRNTIVIAGGVHVTTSFETVISNPDIDYACRGEGEYLLRDLLLSLSGECALPEKGLVYMNNGEIVAQEKIIVQDLTTLPMPDYSFVNLNDYIHEQPRIGPNRHPTLPGTHIHVTRGCPCRCCFCQVEHISGKTIRWRDPVDVVDELQFLKENYNIKSFTFEDDNTFFTVDKAKQLLRELITRNLDLEWRCGALALFALDKELIDLMEKSGCKIACVSVESGCKRVLKEIVKKPIKNLDEVPDIIQMLKNAGILVKASFVIGFPGETWEEIRETVRFAENCNADYVVFFNAVPLPGTPLYEQCRKLDLLIDGKNGDSVDWRHSRIRSDEWTTDDVSILRAYEWDRINFSPDRVENVARMWNASPEELMQIRKQTRDSLTI